MANYLHDNRPTPSGGAYSEIYFFDDKGNTVDEKVATRCVIRECTANGDLINEIWGIANGSKVGIIKEEAYASQVFDGSLQ